MAVSFDRDWLSELASGKIASSAKVYFLSQEKCVILDLPFLNFTDSFIPDQVVIFTSLQIVSHDAAGSLGQPDRMTMGIYWVIDPFRRVNFPSGIRLC